MLAWHRRSRIIGAALVVACLVSPVSAQSPPSLPPSAGAASLLPPEWVVNHEPVTTRLGPDSEAEAFADLRQYTYLQVTGYSGDWAHVVNPRTKVTAWVPSGSIGPTDAPPEYITAEPPPTYAELHLSRRAIRGATLSFYPTPEPEAQLAPLAHNTPVSLLDSVHGSDRELWYRTLEGDYLPASAVRVPRSPPRGFAGAGSTRFAPGGYYLTNVLFTQYFTGDGASIHYNYWSSNWGYSASHGCLGLPYADSAFLWSWASLGTPVFVHR